MNLDEKQIEKIDSLIEAFKLSKNYDSSWNNFAAYVTNCLKINSPNSNFIKGLFIENIPFIEKKFIAICLLRIYNVEPKSVTYNPSFNIAVFKLFDYTLIDIYRACGLKTNSQGYDKQSQLSDFVSNIDRDISIQLTISSLKEIESFENKYRKLVNEKTNYEIFSFFISGIQNDSFISKIFRTINSYLTSSNITKISSYELATKEISELLMRAKELNTKYGILLVSKPFEIIQRLINEDFNNSPMSKPANLLIQLTGKKYPLKILKEKFYINLEIVNIGEGFAYNVKIKILDHNSEISFKEVDVTIGTLDVEKTLRNIECEVIKPEEIAYLQLRISWNDFDGNSKVKDFELQVDSQKGQADDWEELKLKQPYSLKPVTNEDELIGRTKKLNELIALCRNSDSCFVTGQKRVGKTSLVKILQEKILKDESAKTIAVYVSLQPAPSIINTIDSLALNICESIKLSEDRLSNLTIPTINHSFGSIHYFLLGVLRILPGYKIVIIIDEFDQLPIELYRRGDIGDSLFMAFKNISSESKISFILVGGEKMAFIKNVQAIHLNLFKSFSLDYFDAENSWADFEELVRHPVRNELDIESKAIEYIYSYTLGHPYFTKKICQELYTICINNHDMHVTVDEMKKAVSVAISTSDVTDFAHFWDDGIMEKGDKHEEISVSRRKVFLSLLTSNINFEAKGSWSASTETYDLSKSTFENIINEFILRRILSKTSGILYFRIKFFYEWLKLYGAEKIFTTPADEASIIERKKMEELLTVKSEEILELIAYWGPYSGKEITSDKIRKWLNQFGIDPINQRLMFRILQSILFYDNNLIRISSKDIYKSIVRRLTQEKLERVIDSSKRKRDDIIVSYLESSFAKSGSEYAKLFTDENSIYADHAIAKNKLSEFLSIERNIKALIFVDDFAGTGESICRNLSGIHDSIGQLIIKNNIIVFIGVICGFDKAKRQIQNYIEHLPYKVEIIFSKVLDDNDRCFGEYSNVFQVVSERNQAKAICLEQGEKLFPGHPLGFGNCQALVVFPNACPNNTLPILWKATPTWTPLFKRI